MNPKNMLNKKASHKGHVTRFHLCEMESRIKKFIETKSRLTVKDLGMEDIGERVIAKWYSVFFLG